MFGRKHRDPAIVSRARDHAAWLVRDHGDRAEEILRDKMSRENLSEDDRYRLELTARALARRRKQLNQICVDQSFYGKKSRGSARGDRVGKNPGKRSRRRSSLAEWLNSEFKRFYRQILALFR